MEAQQQRREAQQTVHDLQIQLEECKRALLDMGKGEHPQPREEERNALQWNAIYWSNPSK